jgi:hypothetical protein
MEPHLIRIQGFMTKNFLALLDPDSEYGSGSNDLIESGSDPDPKPWILGYRYPGTYLTSDNIFFSMAIKKMRTEAFPPKLGYRYTISKYFIPLFISYRPSSKWPNEQCCGSGMFIPDPDFTHPGSINSNKTEGYKICHTFFL